MSRTAVTLDERPAELPFLDLLAALDALGVTFSRRGATNIALHGGDVLTADLRRSALGWKLILLNVCDSRTELARLHDYIIRLRCENPAKRTRDQAFAYLQARIKLLAGLSVLAYGTEDGWPDPADAFADMDQITGLRHAFDELTRPDAPYPVPLPPGCVLLPEANFDPFEHGRLYNGRMTATAG